MGRQRASLSPPPPSMYRKTTPSFRKEKRKEKQQKIGLESLFHVYFRLLTSEAAAFSTSKKLLLVNVAASSCVGSLTGETKREKKVLRVKN